MRKITEEEAIGLLKKYSTSEEAFLKVLKHVKAVQKKAIEIASEIPDVDRYIIKIGSLLHDIGRFGAPPGKEGIRHGVIGGEILRKEGLPEFAKIAERHIGTGLSKGDIKEQKLPLPEKDYLPESREEKIICYADNFAFGDKLGLKEDIYNKYRTELGEWFIPKLKKLEKEIEDMQNG